MIHGITHIFICPVGKAAVEPLLLVTFNGSQDTLVSGIDRLEVVLYASLFGQVVRDLDVRVALLLHGDDELIIGVKIPGDFLGGR